MVGELCYFIGLQIYQSNKYIFSNQAKYSKEILTIFGIENVKHISTPTSTTCSRDKNKGDNS